MRVKVVAPFIIFLLIGMSACSDAPTTLEFNPKDGESRNYQVHAETRVEAQSSYGDSSDYIRSVMLTEYLVEQSDDTILHLKPTFMRLEYRHGSFASPRTPEYVDEEMREVMGEGFQLHLDDQRKVVDFKINANNSDLQANGQEMLVDVFKDEFSRPGVGHGLELREGASRIIPASGDIPAVTLTLTELREENALVTMSGEGTKIKVFGLAVVERESGWLERATMVTEIEEENQGNSAIVRTVMSLYPSDWVMGMDLEYLRETSMMPLQESVDFSDLQDSVSQAKALPSPTGAIDSRDDKLVLNYIHNQTSDADLNALGLFEFRDVQAFTSEGEPLNLKLQNTEAITYSYYGKENQVSMTELYPLGWQQVHEQLDAIGYIEATIDWYPQTQKVVELEISDQPTQVSEGDATAYLQPTDEDGVYQLVLEHGERVHFDYRVAGPNKIGFGYKPYIEAPEWLDIGETRQLTVTEYGYHPGYYEVLVDENTPNTIQLLAVRVAEEAAANRTVRFYDPKAMNANPHIAPPESRKLYPSDEELEDASFGRLDFEKLDVEINPEAHADGRFIFENFNRPQLYLSLTPEQAGLCEISSSSEKLHWREQDELEGHRKPAGKLREFVVMQVQSEDSERTYFYDETLETTVTCPESMVWQDTEWQPNDTPWLIELDDLEGITANTPATKLLRRYAFLPIAPEQAARKADLVRAQSLTLMAPTTDKQPVPKPLSEAVVKDYLYEGRYLRIAGSVQTVMRLEPTGKTQTFSFEHQFPALPDLSTTSYEQGAVNE